MLRMTILEHQTTKAKTLALAQIASKYGKY